MKTRAIVLIMLGGFFLGGCASTARVATDTVGAGLGAFVGNKLGRGKPVATVLGAGAGVLLGETFNYANDSRSKTAYTDGFEKGRSDAVKQQYWLMVNQQRHDEGREGEGNISLYDIPFPEQKVDGVILKPVTRVLGIEE